MPSMADTYAKACERAIDRAVDAYATLRRTYAGRNAVAKLKRFRDKVVAHTLLGTALKSSPLYRELFLLVDVARDVTEHARLAVEGTHMDLKDVEDNHVEVCRAFWRPALTAAARHGRLRKR